MRWGSIGLAFTAGCGDLAQAESLPTAPDAAASSSSTGRVDGSTGTPDAELDFESTGVVGTSGPASDSSSGAPTVPVDLTGIHDGLYTGNVSIDFISAGSCNGAISITVDSSADPPIVGEGMCQGEILGLPEGGETEVDGELAFDGAMGTAVQILDGEEVEVVWQGAFNQTNFTGTFEGEVELFGVDLEFEGVWNADR